MHHQRRLARRQAQALPRAINMIDKLSPPGGRLLRRFPELLIGVAEPAGEFVMAPSGPRAEILFAEAGLFDPVEPA